VILILPFIKKYREKYCKRKIRVIYTDVQSDTVNPSNYGHGQTRLEKARNNKRVNPIYDFLENISFIDEKIGGDPTKAKDYWVPDKIFRKRWGEYLTPSEYQLTLFQEIFSNQDMNAAKNFWHSNLLDKKFVIAFHFRRASDKIMEMFRIINNDPIMKKFVQCLFLGSSLNQILPDIDSNACIDLTDNYSKGIPLRTLYRIVMKCQLYIGGRGSFEHFFWIARVPSINFIDEYALVQDQNAFGTWIPEFWSQNRFNEILHYETADPEDIYDRMVYPYFIEWKRGNYHSN